MKNASSNGFRKSKNARFVELVSKVKLDPLLITGTLAQNLNRMMS
jgi:hypothetical protein